MLDVGCGTGNVARLLADSVPLLRVVGIDSAQVRAAHHPRVRILPGTTVESLPFAAASIGAAVSRFGFEYSDIDTASKELARVLRTGAPISFIVHHSNSPIVRRSRIHNAALRALTGEPMRAAFLSGSAAVLAHCARTIAEHCPGERIIEVVARGLMAAIGRTHEGRVAVWQAVCEALAPDRILSDALAANCVAPRDLEQWLAPLKVWFDVRHAAELRARGEPIAWKIEGVRTR